MKLLRAWLVTVCLAGVAHAQEPQARTQMSASEVKIWLGFFDKLVETVAGSRGTCEQLATDVAGLVDQNKTAITIARDARAKGRKLPEAAQQRMLEGVKRMVPTLQKCGEHDKVRAAFAKLDLTRRN
jgi:hypothetical protein